MAAFYIDHDVAFETVWALRARRHAVVTARDLGLERADDPEHLLIAAKRRAIFVTHNREDFILLHIAWRLWSADWGIECQHEGVLVIPAAWRGDVAAAHIERFLLDRTPTNELHVGLAHGDWRRRG